MGSMQELTIDERDFSEPAQLMGYLKSELEFPEWFGGNLAALNDCLGDICEPTRITIVRRDPTPDTWFDKVCTVIVRVALENECLKVRIR